MHGELLLNSQFVNGKVFDKLIRTLMLIVTTCAFWLTLNGERFGYLKGGRGLRQGDPVSPYLFTIVMEVLNLILLRRINQTGQFTYHQGCEELKITNLCFADDLLILSSVDVSSVQLIKEALEQFTREN